MSESAAATATAKRQLTIKTGVVKRLTKEEKTYVKEAEEQRKRVAQYEQDPQRDEWDVKKQKEVLDDCLKMIPDCQTRLQAAIADLENIVEGVEGELAQAPEAEAAREALQAAKEASAASSS